MGVRLDLRSKLVEEETATAFVAVLTERSGEVPGATGRVNRLLPSPDPARKYDQFARELVPWNDRDVDWTGDGDYCYSDLAPGWYEARSRSGTQTSHRVFFRVDGESISDVVRPPDYDRDTLFCAVLGISPDDLAASRMGVDEARIAEAKAQGLPQLTGTEKQVRYAIVVRAAILLDAGLEIGVRRHRLEQKGAARDPASLARLEWAEVALAQIRKIDHARWWLDRHDWTTQRVLDDAVARCRAGQGVAL